MCSFYHDALRQRGLARTFGRLDAAGLAAAAKGAVERPCAGVSDEQEDRGEHLRVVGAGLVEHGPDAGGDGASGRRRRAEIERDLRREDRDD
jgi:hypothetical protein